MTTAPPLLLVAAVVAGLAPAGRAAVSADRPAAGLPDSRREQAPAAGQAGRTGPRLPFAPGEEIDLDIDFRSVHSGKAKLTVGRPEGTIWPMIWTARSDGVAAIFDIRVHYVAFWDSQSGMARGSDLNAIEVNDRHTDRVRFDRDEGTARVAVLRKGELREKTREVAPDAQELAGALLRVRAMDSLLPGSRIECPVFTGSDAFTLRAEVVGRETLGTPAGRFDTVHVAVQLGATGRFSTRGPAHVWVSADDRRIPVRMEGDFAVGTFTATLAAYRPGGPYVAKP